MQESKEREAPGQRDDSNEQLRERQTEATSNDTLRDLEAKRKISETRTTSEEDALAPDAQPEEPRKHRDDAGPI